MAPCFARALVTIACLRLATPAVHAAQPSIYDACGMGAPGKATTEQALCLAAELGVTAGEPWRVVRPGFDRSLAEPTLDLCFADSVRDPKFGRRMRTVQLSVSDLDGRILHYGSPRERCDIPAFAGAWSMADMPLRGDTTPIASRCGFESGSAVTDATALCMARALGVEEGIDGIRIFRERNGRPVLEMGNTLQSEPCYSVGTRLVLEPGDATVLEMGWTIGECACGPQETHRFIRPMRGSSLRSE